MFAVLILIFHPSPKLPAMLHRSFLLSFGLLLSIVSPGHGQGQPAGQTDDKAQVVELLDLVGADAGLCLEVSNLGQRLPQFTHSELFDRLERLPVYLDWKQSTEFRKLAEIQKAIETQTGLPLGQFAVNLFGQSVVFAVYPREGQEPAGVLLLRAADNESLAKALSAWNQDSRVKLETLSFSTGQYHKRTEGKDKEEKSRPQFYFLEGAVFALSDDEAVIRKIVAMSRGESEGPALSESENFQKAKSSLPEDCWAMLYFDPRAWKTGWEFDSGKSKAEKAIAGLWKRCHAVALGVRADQGLAIDLILHYDPTDLPERWQQFIKRAGGFPEFLNRVPARAFLVFAGKQDLTGVDKLITAEMNEAARQQWQNARQIGRGFLLGLDLFNDVLPKFRANWGMYVVAREPLEGGALPVEALVAFELPPVDEDQKPITLRKALENALMTGFNVLAAVHNSKSPAKPALVKSEPNAEFSVHWIESLGPYRPAYCLSGEYLIFASSPAVVTEFLSPALPKLTDSRVFQLWTQRDNSPKGQVLFINWQAIREFLAKNRAFLLDQAVESHALPRDEAEKRLTRLEDVLEVLDAVYVGVQILPDQIRLTTGGITVK